MRLGDTSGMSEAHPWKTDAGSSIEEVIAHTVRFLARSSHMAREKRERRRFFTAPPSPIIPPSIAPVTTLSPGTRFGPYDVLAAIGAGGPAFARLLDADDELRRRLAEAKEPRCS